MESMLLLWSFHDHLLAAQPYSCLSGSDSLPASPRDVEVFNDRSGGSMCCQ